MGLNARTQGAIYPFLSDHLMFITERKQDGGVHHEYE